MFQPMISLRGDYQRVLRSAGIACHERQSAHDGCRSAAEHRTLDLDQWVLTQTLKKLAAHRHRNPDTRLIVPLGSGSVLVPTSPPGWRRHCAPRSCPPTASVSSSRTARSTVRSSRPRTSSSACARSLSAGVADIHSANDPIPDLALLRPQFARIDVALAQALTDSDATNTLLKPLIDSLHQEQIASIMPGVEGAGVMAVLWQLGVNFIQGNYLQAATAEMQYEFTDLT